MMSFLVVKHIALVVISVLTAIPALECLLTNMDVHLVRQKRLPRGKSLSTVAAMKFLIFFSCVHRPHVKFNPSEHPTTDVAGHLSFTCTSLVVLKMICVL